MKIFICLMAFNASLLADHVIICGSGGDPEYRERFTNWGSQLKMWLRENTDRNDGVHLFQEAGGADDTADGFTSLETLQSFFQKLAKEHSPDKNLFIYLIGHGSYLQDISKFQIPGPDLTATELNRLVSTVPSENVVVVNAASSGAGFINELSGPHRIICTATRSVGEKSAPQFMAHFLEGLKDGSADRNRDTRISVHEAASQAAALTEAWYVGTGLIATEHAILDDNGDSLGSRLHDLDRGPDRPKNDGERSKKVFIKPFSFPPQAPQELITSYLEAMKEVEALQEKKGALSQEAYYGQLEQKILAAARLHRKIRNFGAQNEP